MTPAPVYIYGPHASIMAFVGIGIAATADADAITIGQPFSEPIGTPNRRAMFIYTFTAHQVVAILRRLRAGGVLLTVTVDTTPPPAWVN